MATMGPELKKVVSPPKNGFLARSAAINQCVVCKLENNNEAMTRRAGANRAAQRSQPVGASLTVVVLRHLLGGVDELHGDELVSLLLEALDDLADEAALHAVGLDGDEAALVLGTGHSLWGELGIVARDWAHGRHGATGDSGAKHCAGNHTASTAHTITTFKQTAEYSDFSSLPRIDPG
jgi:hypothetical protein